MEFNWSNWPFKIFPQLFVKIMDYLHFWFQMKINIQDILNLPLIDSGIIHQLNLLSSAFTEFTTPVRPIGHIIDV